MKLGELHELPPSRVVEGWKDQQWMVMDSALRSHPLLRFYFAVQNKTNPLGNQANSFEVIDGLQRIVAFTDFLEDRWELLDPTANRGRFPRAVADAPSPWAARRFSELSEWEQFWQQIDSRLS